MKTPLILHIDMDSFFVSVERLYNPELLGVPVAVAVDNRRSVVASASYEARAFGVRSAMASSIAKAKCPQLVLVEPNAKRYQELSRRVFEIFERFTPRVERLGIDEAFLDVTGSVRLFGSALKIAEQIRQTVRQELGLPCSVGIAATKFVAKIASVKAKPDGVCEVPAAKTLEFLYPLPVGDVYGVGPKTAAKLTSRAVHTVSDLAQMSEESLIRLLGKAMGRQLYQLARGVDPRQVEVTREIKSMSHESTFDYDTANRKEITMAFAHLTQKLARRLRAADLEAGVIGVSVCLADFTHRGTHRRLATPTNANVPLYNCVLEQLAELLEPEQRVRRLGVGVGSLRPQGTAQLRLWEEPEGRWQHLDETVDRLQEKFAGLPIMSARMLERAQENSSGATVNGFDSHGHSGGFRVVD